MKIYKPSLAFYTAQIEAGDPFSFIRYGDGEWSAILGDRVRTSSGSHTLTLRALRDDLYESLTKPRKADNCYYSLRETSVNHRAEIRGRRITAWLRANANGIGWHDCRVFYLASRRGNLYPFVQALRNSPLPVVVVGPGRLRPLDGKLCDFGFIEIPNKDAYVKKTRIIRQVCEVGTVTPSLFLFVAGPAAKALIYKLYKPLGETCIMLDVGSLLDVYVGKRSREYHKKMTPETIRRNLTGA